MSIEYVYDTILKTLVLEDGLSRMLITQKYIPYKIELEPWYEFIPKSWKSGENLMTASGFKFSCGVGVSIFSKTFFNDKIVGTFRGKIPYDSGYYQIFNSGGRPSPPWKVKIEYGRTVNEEDIVDITYEVSIICNGKSGQGRGYPAKILTWDSRPELHGEVYHGCWFMLMRTSDVEELVYVLRDLDSGELLHSLKSPLGIGESGYMYALNLKSPSGDRHLRFSLESIEGEIYDYFNMC